VAGSFQVQLERLIRVSREQVEANTALLIWPETALYSYYGFEENNLRETPDLAPLWSFLRDYPNLSLFTGIESIRQFDRPTKYSQPYGNAHLESYNGAALLDSGGAHGFYHKSMLVPGVETLPWFLKFLGRWFDKFGGTTAGYARQEERTVISEKNGFRIAPAICYESIYGEFMSRYVKGGANLICVITNDGWWKKTPGHRQHMNYARLRAIETRTWVARSANTGISCFISPRGEVLEPRPYNTEAAIKWNLTPAGNPVKTLFVRWGDWLSRIMLGGAVLMIVITVIVKLKRRTASKQKG
jgi:apolipoprotein N-acyltransferase